MTSTPTGRALLLVWRVKNVPRYFGKVQRKSNVCIIRFDWLISFYMFISLVSNTIFLIIKNSGVREELSYLPFFFRHNCNKSLWKNTFLVSLLSQPSPLVCAPPQLSLFHLANSFYPLAPQLLYHLRGRLFPTHSTPDLHLR